MNRGRGVAMTNRSGGVHLRLKSGTSPDTTRLSEGRAEVATGLSFLAQVSTF
jgi:hypothetical protein